jgi:hypothetical protein
MGVAEDGKSICPHCWFPFSAEEALAIAQHQSLLGDPVLGENAPQRFLPSRFTPEGHALDAYGLPCPDLACPSCHLPVPHPVLETRPVFFSIIGAPASGKSYLLATMIHRLRSLMPKLFGFNFTDADPHCNVIINDYEQTLFHAADDSAYVALAKTDLQGQLYTQLTLNDMRVNLPQPFMFSLTPQLHHPSYGTKGDALAQSLVLYDNAGEHFQPGMESATNPGTKHLVHARALFFVFDPTQDARFRKACVSDDPQMEAKDRVNRQEVLLAETITRLRRSIISLRNGKTKRPLIIVVTKFDVWRRLLKLPERKPYVRKQGLSTACLDYDYVMLKSFAVRSLLKRLCPELVSTAESFASNVWYLPTSALGRSPTKPTGDAESKGFVIRPRDIAPVWAEVPIITALALMGLIKTIRRQPTVGGRSPAPFQVSGDRLLVKVEGHRGAIEVPKAYLGHTLLAPGTGNVFRVPTASELGGAAESLLGG